MQSLKNKLSPVEGDAAVFTALRHYETCKHSKTCKYVNKVSRNANKAAH